MARIKSKAKAARLGASSRPVLEAHVNPNDPIPSVLTNYLQSLQINEQGYKQVSEKRPAKRQRTSDHIDYVTILRDELNVSGPVEDSDAAVCSLHLINVASHLNFKLAWSKPVENAEGSWILEISPRLGPRNGQFRIGFSLGDSAVPDLLRKILWKHEVPWSNSGAEDFIWVNASTNMFQARGDGVLTLKFIFEVNWNVSSTSYSSWLSSGQRKYRQDILETAFPSVFGNIDGPEESSSCSPQIFYEAAHVPSSEGFSLDKLQVPGLTTKLYPFQSRAVNWLLNREGVYWNKYGNNTDGSIQDIEDDSDHPDFFTEVRDVDGNGCHVSQLLGKVTKDLTPFKSWQQQFRGGILAEEMGLGKTLEMIALFILHPRPATADTIFDLFLLEEVRTTSGTLIVAPNSLKDQWIQELERHAPELRVMLYTGIGKTKRRRDSEEALLQELSSQDVVITTYNVLSAELDFAIAEPDRARRAPRKYHRPKSPLTQLSWWRLCLDEAQMIESPTKAASLARMIPRVNAWGVTGTPVKDSVDDLRGLLIFLRYEPFASNIQTWNTLVNSYPESFSKLFHMISLRHTKRLVGHEISIPAQKRFVITMPFTAVEEQHYQSLFQELTYACGLNMLGEPLNGDWDPDNPRTLEQMRVALDRLRKTALHPEIGQRNRRALGHGIRPMRTLAEVLEVMLEQSELAIRTEKRNLLLTSLQRGQLLENSPRVKTALAIWQEVLQASDAAVSECRKQLQHEIHQAKASGKPGDDSASGQDGDDADANENNTGRVGDARRRLRSALEIQHKTVFFIANAHFQIKSNKEMTKPGSEEFGRLEELETKGYDLAKKIRREILEESRCKATRLIQRISNSASKQSFAVIPEFKSLPRKGIESRGIVDTFEELCGALNEQADIIDDVREQVVQLLMKPLVDEDDDLEVTGDEYTDSTTLMETIVVYVTALRTVIADRDDAMTGQTNELVKTEIESAIELAKGNEGPFPEKLLELLALRDRIKPKAELGSLRRVVSELRSLSVKLRYEAVKGNNRARLELDIVLEQLRVTQKQFTEQQKITTTISTQEVDLFTTCMNAQVEYYRQLQAISDTLAPYEGPKDDRAMSALLEQEQAIQRRLETAEAKHRYLVHLGNKDKADDEQRICVICREPFIVGILTVCGHQFCKEDMMMWWKAHHNCPVCKRSLTLSNLHDITLRPQELKVQSEPSPQAIKFHNRSIVSKKSTIYAEFNPQKLADIKSIVLNGPAFTTKVDYLVRHLLWLRESDPGAKSIVFSQYPEFLKVVSLALQRYKIGHTFFETANGTTEFKNNPICEVFMLNARSHASGLNLVNASHVFLCDPLINTALELQAIARVHRIGQEQETTVWLLLVEGTVEESIYNLSVQRRMEHVGDKGKGKSKDSTPELLDESLEAANAQALEQASLSKLMGKGKTQGEVVDKGDLWGLLFGHVVRSRDESREQLRGNQAVRVFLAAEAAEQRRQDGQDGGSGRNDQPGY